MERDPLEYEDSLNLFEYVHSSPVDLQDPSGLGSGSKYPAPKGYKTPPGKKKPYTRQLPKPGNIFCPKEKGLSARGTAIKAIIEKAPQVWLVMYKPLFDAASNALMEKYVQDCVDRGGYPAIRYVGESQMPVTRNARKDKERKLVGYQKGNFARVYEVLCLSDPCAALPALQKEINRHRSNHNKWIKCLDKFNILYCSSNRHWQLAGHKEYEYALKAWRNANRDCTDFLQYEAECKPECMIDDGLLYN